MKSHEIPLNPAESLPIAGIVNALALCQRPARLCFPGHHHKELPRTDRLLWWILWDIISHEDIMGIYNGIYNQKWKKLAHKLLDRGFHV